MPYLIKIVRELNNLVFKKKTQNEFLKLNDIELSNKLISYNDVRKFGYNKTFCFAPQNSLYFKFNGDVIACCKNNLDIYGNIRSNSIDEIWSSAVRIRLKSDIENYNYNKGCDFCYRQLENKNYSGVHAILYDNHYNRYINHQFPTEVTFEISNKCNLECIMCDGYRSSSIRKNREKLAETPDVYPANFLEQLIPFIPHFKVVRLQGGEPFLIPFYLDLIDKIGELNKKCKIYIQTNGTILSDRIRKIIDNRQIELSVSTDAFNKSDYEFIRKNSNFNKTIQNILDFNQIFRQRNKKLNINYCVLSKNILKIHEAIDFCNEHELNLQFIIVDNPASLSIFNLDEKEINDIKLYLNTCINKYKSHSSVLNEILNCLSNEHTQIQHEYSTDELYDLLFKKLTLLLPEENINFDVLKTKIDNRTSGNHQKYLLQCLLTDTINLQKSHFISGTGLEEYLNVFLSRKDILINLKN